MTWLIKTVLIAVYKVQATYTWVNHKVGDSGTVEEFQEGHSDWGQRENQKEWTGATEGRKPRSCGALLTILKILTFIPRAIGSHWKVLWGLKEILMTGNNLSIQLKGEDFKNYITTRNKILFIMKNVHWEFLMA